jgi:hypothetical protein
MPVSLLGSCSLTWTPVFILRVLSRSGQGNGGMERKRGRREHYASYTVQIILLTLMLIYSHTIIRVIIQDTCNKKGLS